MSLGIVSYKGYQGRVSFEDDVLLIQIMHVRDFVSAECTDAGQVSAEFKSLVDRYLDHCKSVGKNPDKPFSGTFNVRLGEELHRQAAMAAAREGASLNDLVVRAVGREVGRRALDQQAAVRAVSEAWTDRRAAETTVYQYFGSADFDMQAVHFSEMIARTTTTSPNSGRGEYVQLNELSHGAGSRRAN